ncbi:hypothetical protein [Methylobacter sp. BlB1]|uniref:hypothetical protein n=1 Tax=Methylobacter sp. BlB1 TaxID=2785914 RepID=UPI001894F1A8|nr:hypothetical protein [Methylobacter sp. BlB1]MBF6648640.1 hypothetical protein [Methylobacter sp. BlB1]
MMMPSAAKKARHRPGLGGKAHKLALLSEKCEVEGLTGRLLRSQIPDQQRTIIDLNRCCLAEYGMRNDMNQNSGMAGSADYD